MKKICIIGAGASGLPAIKCCLDEGLIPVCFERTHDIGGLWRYDKDKEEGGSVYKSTIINTSKEMMSYSDYPIPKEYANFMHNTKIMEYLRLYAKQFDLLSHISFNTEVMKCEPAEDYETTGRWKVTTKDRKLNDMSTGTFDGVLVCTGHCEVPHFPCHSFPGFDKYKGTYLHSRSYKQPFDYLDKNVVVIGIGNSGGDVAVELGYHARKVILSTRRGSWFVQRVGPNGYPFDYSDTTRINRIVKNVIPLKVLNWVRERKLNKRFDHAIYGLKPKHGILNQHTCTNDLLPNSIISGMVTIQGNVKEFTETGVLFEDGSFQETDVVVFATGYLFNFPFLDESILEVRNNECRLYRHMWPPQLKHGSLAVIGGIQPLGAINPVSEMQCRWATRVFKGTHHLPSREVMERNIDEKISEMNKRFFKSIRHTIEVEYDVYMDEIASEIGAKPNLIRLFKEDIKLAMKLLLGPVTPYQYRLVGPGNWPEARHTIMTQQDRVLCPFSLRKVERKEEDGRLIFCCCVVAIPAILYFIGQSCARC